VMCADLQTLEQTVVCTFRELFDALEYAEEHGWHQQRLVVHVFARRIWTRSIDRPYHHENGFSRRSIHNGTHSYSADTLLMTCNVG